MTTEKKLELLADILEMDVNDLNPETRIEDLEWDSITALSFIAMMDEQFDKAVRGADIKQFVTVQDALDMMER